MHDLFIECDGRPHWGKFHFFNQESARAAFPRFDDFNTSSILTASFSTNRRRNCLGDPAPTHLHTVAAIATWSR